MVFSGESLASATLIVIDTSENKIQPSFFLLLYFSSAVAIMFSSTIFQQQKYLDATRDLEIILVIMTFHE